MKNIYLFGLIMLLVFTGSVSFGAVWLDEDFEAGTWDSRWGTHLEGGSVEVVGGSAKTGSYGFHAHNNATKRAEIQMSPSSAANRVHWSTEYWFSQWVRADDSTSGEYNYVTQFHGVPQDIDWSTGGGSNPFSIRQQGQVLILQGQTDPNCVGVTPAHGGADWCAVNYHTQAYTDSQWYNIVYHFKLEYDNTGYFQIWVDGTQVVDHTGVTVYDLDGDGDPKEPFTYMKIGNYSGSGGYAETSHDDIFVYEGAYSYAQMVTNGGATPLVGGATSSATRGSGTSQLSLGSGSSTLSW